MSSLNARDFLPTLLACGQGSSSIFFRRPNFCHAIIYHPWRTATEDRDKIISFQTALSSRLLPVRAVRNRGARYFLCSLPPALILSRDLLPVTSDQYLIRNKIIYNPRCYYPRSIARTTYRCNQRFRSPNISVTLAINPNRVTRTARFVNINI